VGHSIERREQRDHLVEPAIETLRGSGPMGRDKPIPERLRVRRVVQQPAVAEIPQLAAERQLRAGLVDEQPSRERRVVERRLGHARTITRDARPPSSHEPHLR